MITLAIYVKLLPISILPALQAAFGGVSFVIYYQFTTEQKSKRKL
jgi:hypothetical protein